MSCNHFGFPRAADTGSGAAFGIIYRTPGTRRMRSIAMTLAAICAALSMASASAEVKKVKPKPTIDPGITQTPAPPSPQPIPYPNRHGSVGGSAADVAFKPKALVKRKGAKTRPYMEFKMKDAIISHTSGASLPPKGPKAGILESEADGRPMQGPSAIGIPAQRTSPVQPSGRLY